MICKIRFPCCSCMQHKHSHSTTCAYDYGSGFHTHQLTHVARWSVGRCEPETIINQSKGWDTVRNVKPPPSDRESDRTHRIGVSSHGLRHMWEYGALNQHLRNGREYGIASGWLGRRRHSWHCHQVCCIICKATDNDVFVMVTDCRHKRVDEAFVIASSRAHSRPTGDILHIAMFSCP